MNVRCCIIAPLYEIAAVPSPSQGRGRWNRFHVTVIGYWRLAPHGCWRKLDYDGRNPVSGELQTESDQSSETSSRCARR